MSGPAGQTPRTLEGLMFHGFALTRRARLRRFMASGGYRDPSTFAAPFALPRPLPRRLWLYWAQGEAAAPPLVRWCVDSWRRDNPGWSVRVLDAQNEAEAVDMSDVPAMPLNKRANILRLRLLNAHGGVWVDATCLSHRPLDAWLPSLMQSGFFAFARPGPDRLLDNWFFAAEPGCPLALEWERRCTRYWSANPSNKPYYFSMHYLFEWMLLRRPDLRAIWEATPKVSALGPLALDAALEDARFHPAALAALATGAPFSKLTHKRPIDRAAVETLLAEARVAGGPAPADAPADADETAALSVATD